MKNTTTARIHEHAGRIALLLGNGKTVYLTPAMAIELGIQLKHAGKQIRNAYHYPTTYIED